jgi:hypothetical protein
MSDPFLRAHRHSSKLFSLAGRTPLSIRDQVLRAQTLVERLISTKALQAGSSLLVVGAGAAGATVAVLAARCGVRVTAVDTNKFPFGLQRLCTSRWVDPVQYDWPLSHASRTHWPGAYPAPAVPFGFKADYASIIAHRWAITLNIERRSPNLNVEYKTRLEKLPRPSLSSPGMLDAVTEKAGYPSQTRPFDVVVLPVGMASERTDAPFHATAPKGSPRFVGVPFWMRDDFETKSFGLATPLAHPVLVSGGGDGALQDYIRLMTGSRSALELLDKVFVGTAWSPVRQRLELLQLLEAEQEVERALQWNDGAAQDHDRLSALHKHHKSIVQRWHTSSSWSAIESVLLGEMSGRPIDMVMMVHSCDHFSGCYPLNRFMALLIDEVVTVKLGRNSIGAGHRLRAARPVTSRPHACALGCWGPDHEVEIEVASTCFGKPGPATRMRVSGLVIRHGINKHSPAAWLRHILPRELV